MTPTAFSSLPTSKEAARQVGSKHYRCFTNCRNGHENPVRITNSGLCKECLRLRNANKDPEAVRHNQKQALQRFNDRIKTDEEFRKAVRERQKKLYHFGGLKEKKLKYRKEYVARPEAKQRRRERERKNYYEKLRFDASYKEAAKRRSSQWSKVNSDKCNEKTNLRRAARLNATPNWLEAGDRKAMRELYALAKQVSAATGVPHEVDHIVPLRGVEVSGLHVPWNLQVIPRSENRAKFNKLAAH